MLLSSIDRSSLALLVLHKLDQHAHDHNKREANIAVLAPVSVKWVACRTNASPEIPSQSTYGVYQTIRTVHIGNGRSGTTHFAEYFWIIAVL
jgi:hypothetical protein